MYSWRTSTAIRLHYIRDVPTADRELAALPHNGPLGFDLEWKPVYLKGQRQNPVAIVQLANNSVVLLLQVSAMPHFPSKLQQLLENPLIVKAGVGIQYDTKKLFTDYAISTRNCVDLSLLARSVDNARWKGRYSNPIGLARLVETYEQLSLPKAAKVQRSNWETLLTDLQQDYAANDAHSGFALYTRLMRMAQAMPRVPDPVCYSFNSINGILYEPCGMLWRPHNPDYDPGPPPPPKETKEDGTIGTRTGPASGSRPHIVTATISNNTSTTVLNARSPEFTPRRGYFHSASTGGRGKPGPQHVNNSGKPDILTHPRRGQPRRPPQGLPSPAYPRAPRQQHQPQQQDTSANMTSFS